MDDIRLVVQSTLDNYFYDRGVAVYAELLEPNSLLPDEYIIHSVVTENYARYANNTPIFLKSNIDVKYICKDINKKTTRGKEIITTMENAGFRMINSNRDLSVEKDSKYFGMILEFTIERFITHE